MPTSAAGSRCLAVCALSVPRPAAGASRRGVAGSLSPGDLRVDEVFLLPAFAPPAGCFPCVLAEGFAALISSAASDCLPCAMTASAAAISTTGTPNSCWYCSTTARYGDSSWVSRVSVIRSLKRSALLSLTSFAVGSVIVSRVVPVAFSIARNRRRSRLAANRMASPVRPARPVRPIRCT